MKRFYRSRTDRKISGVCGGLGQLWNVDPTLIRLGLVVLFIATGFVPFGLVYIVAWIIVPEEPVETGAEQSTPPPAGAQP
jgi:phage shock protein PspC (stress-responsive transcriptional regulator)